MLGIELNVLNLKDAIHSDIVMGIYDLFFISCL